jgi:hypothetical protein
MAAINEATEFSGPLITDAFGSGWPIPPSIMAYALRLAPGSARRLALSVGKKDFVMKVRS